MCMQMYYLFVVCSIVQKSWATVDFFIFFVQCETGMALLKHAQNETEIQGKTKMHLHTMAEPTSCFTELQTFTLFLSTSPYMLTMI